jgi:hypothetical protein
VRGGVLEFGIVAGQASQALEHSADLIGEVAFGEFAPCAGIERSAPRALLNGEQVVAQTQVRGTQRIARAISEAVGQWNG